MLPFDIHFSWLVYLQIAFTRSKESSRISNSMIMAMPTYRLRAPPRLAMKPSSCKTTKAGLTWHPIPYRLGVCYYRIFAALFNWSDVERLEVDVRLDKILLDLGLYVIRVGTLRVQDRLVVADIQSQLLLYKWIQTEESLKKSSFHESPK